MRLPGQQSVHGPPQDDVQHHKYHDDPQDRCQGFPQRATIDYQILNPDKSFLLDMIPTDTPYRGQLWQSGNHVIEVINRTNAPQEFFVEFSID